VRAGDVFAALVVGLLVFAGAALALRARRTRSLTDRLRAHIPEMADTDRQAQRGLFLTPLVSVADRVISAGGARRRLEAALERAGSDLSPGQLALLMGGSALGGLILFRLLGLPVAVALLVVPVGGLLPLAVLRRKAAQRQRAFEEQLPDLLMTMAASARVGHTFRQSMQTIVTEGQEPAATEFRRALVETDLGRPLERALADMAERLGSRNFAYVVNVVTIQREVGGSLAGLFDLVSETVRNRQQFTQKVRALTATGRISAYVLVALPFVAAGLMSITQPGYLTPFFTSPSGRILIVVALGGMTLGAIILKKMVSFRIG
jgi:tight adherence protein B